MSSEQLSNLTLGQLAWSFGMEPQEGLDGIRLHCHEKHGLTLKRIRCEFQCSFCNFRGGAEFMSEHINENHPDQMAAEPICKIGPQGTDRETLENWTEENEDMFHWTSSRPPWLLCSYIFFYKANFSLSFKIHTCFFLHVWQKRSPKNWKKDFFLCFGGLVFWKKPKS